MMKCTLTKLFYKKNTLKDLNDTWNETAEQKKFGIILKLSKKEKGYVKYILWIDIALIRFC